MIYKITDVYQTYMGLLSRSYSKNIFDNSKATRIKGFYFVSSKNMCYTRCQWHSGTSYKILEENGY
jgi:hypothetical protein